MKKLDPTTTKALKAIQNDTKGWREFLLMVRKYNRNYKMVDVEDVVALAAVLYNRKLNASFTTQFKFGVPEGKKGLKVMGTNVMLPQNVHTKSNCYHGLGAVEIFVKYAKTINQNTLLNWRSAIDCLQES